MPRNSARQFQFLVLFAILVGAFQNCGYIAAPMDVSLLASQLNGTSSVSGGIAFKDVQTGVLNTKCVACHSASLKSGGLDLSTYSATMTSVIAGNAAASTLYKRASDGTMPQGGPALDSAGQKLIADWINGGAKETASNAANVPPVVSAGANQTVRLPTTAATLYGSASDSDGLISTIQWTKVSGANVTLSGASTTTLTVTGLALGTYVFQLTVTDDRNGQSSSQVTVTVIAANAPTPTPTPTPAPTPAPTPTPVPSVTASFSSIKTNIILQKCIGCHSAMGTYASLVGNGDWIVKGNANNSGIYARTANQTMPPGGGAYLNTTELNAIQTWINNGAPNN